MVGVVFGIGGGIFGGVVVCIGGGGGCGVWVFGCCWRYVYFV